ncbi:MAG TPA: SH3 domain-containing protein [Cyclobacteriaceae bacterium]|jgi:hypothetical protein|nr:SH3 domain-containing protein [Cyclobacteriaceae bacterium]
MKNLQTGFSKFIVIITFFFSYQYSVAQSQKIIQADSLFRAKQYTQSLEVYQSLFSEQKYSPAMLLKMAYIQEGLGKIGQTLYCLKLYHLATDDEQALRKMEELSGKFGLSGYERNDASRLQQWIDKKITIVQFGLAAILLMICVLIFIRKNKEQKPWFAAAAIVLVATSIFYLNNFYSDNSVIVNNDRAYLMQGPSAGAPVVGIVAEGNQLQLLGQNDVWLKVKWQDKIVYVKNNSVLTITL